MAEVAYSFGTDDIARPARSDEPVELMDVEGRTTVIHESTDAVFLHFTPFMVVMMMVMAFPFFVVMVVVMLFVFVVMAAVGMRFTLFFFGCGPFDFANPSGRGCRPFEIEQMGVQQFVQIDIRIVAFDYFG